MAVGLVITVAFLASAAASMLGGAAQGGVAALGTAAGSEASRPGGPGADPNAYYVDSLLRSNSPAASQTDSRGEVGIIFANALKNGSIPAADRAYLDQLVAARTGMTPAEADQRVSDPFAQAQQAADAARKALAHLSIWMFIALLIGAFCASLSATIGGRQRDHVVLV